MHEPTNWMTVFFILGPMLLGISALFIGLAVYNRKQAKLGKTPGQATIENSGQPGQSARNMRGPPGKDNAMSKSGAQVLEPGTIKTRFADVAGCDEAKEELAEIAQYLLEPGLFSEMGAKMPKGVLLVGPPGTGKTLLARALAGECNATFMSISGPAFVEMYVGIGAARVRDLFTEARKKTPCIIFVDEIDAVGRKRSNAPNSNDERENTLNQLLVELDGFAEQTGVIVIAATNRVDILDPALIRPGRFDRHVNVDLPDRNGREKIFGVHARNKPLAADVSHHELSRMTPGFSGAEIEGVCNEAATVAARRLLKVKAANPEAELVKEITASDFDEGLLRVQVGVAQTSKKVAYSQTQLLNTAVHEVGHGWLSEALDGGFPVSRITVLSRASSLGHTMALPEEDEPSMSKTQILTRVSVLLAGRIAQEEILGVVDTGAQDDFNKASDLARQFVTRFGMSDLGPAAALGADSQDGVVRVGPAFANEIDAQIRGVIKSCEETARLIIHQDKVAMKKLALMLVEKETMLKDEWKAAKEAALKPE